MVPTRIVSTWWMAYSKHLEEMLGKTAYYLSANLKQRIALFNVVLMPGKIVNAKRDWSQERCDVRTVLELRNDL